MNLRLKQGLYAAAAGACIAISLYCLFGVLQAMFFFEGERATRNYLFWGPALLISSALAGFLLVRTLRVRV